jgi:hypothetical protein
MIGPNLGYREQILQSLARKPDLSGVIHGQRPVLKGAPYRRVSTFDSVKSGGTFILECGIEAATAPCIESSRGIARWAAQGLRIELSSTEWLLIDFVAIKTDGSLIALECKASIKGLSADEIERYAIAKDLLAREGIEFRLIDRYMVPTKTKLDELRTYYTRGHHQKWSAAIVEISLDILRSANCPSIAEARRVLASEKIPAHICDYLVFHRMISFKDAVNDSMEIAA